MIIFTNENSHHLLLNNDLIDIAFTCLENSIYLTFEAQNQVARLTSLLLRFHYVQTIIFKRGEKKDKKDAEQINDDQKNSDEDKLNLNKEIPKAILGISNLINLCIYDLI